MQKSKKKSFLLVILFISMFIVIPNLLISIQRDIAIPIDEKNPNEIINTRPPQESSVYYEDTDGLARGIYVSGDYAYVADDTYGLAVINISDPTNPGMPVYTGSVGQARGVYVNGDYAYVANDTYGLAVIDISDPTNPEWVTQRDTSGDARGVYVSGNYAYVADGSSGLAIINISDPTNPGTPVYNNTNGYAYDVFVSGDYAYVADYNSGLAVIDISDPTIPENVSYADPNGLAVSVCVSGDYAYVAAMDSGLAVINISDPTNPETVNYADTSGSARSVDVSGNYAYVADYGSGLAVINISDPINPETLVYEDTTGLGYGVYVSGDCAYVADYDSGLAVIDISVPIDPETPVYEDTTGIAYGIYVSGDYAYMGVSGSGLAVIDISDPTNPGAPVYTDTNGDARDVYVSGDYAYVAEGSFGLAVINISNPTTQGAYFWEPTPGWAYDVYVSGDYAYVASSDSGLAVIDISDPTNPGLVNYTVTDGSAHGVYVSGDYAYVADNAEGLAVINISDPINPVIVGYADTDGLATSVYVSGDYAYLASDNYGLAIINISDPTNPGLVTYANTDGYATGVYVSGDYAYVADLNFGLAVINISDPINPVIVSDADTAGIANDIYVSGDYAYIADGSTHGLAVIQVRKRNDMKDPIISNAPNNFTVEVGYSGQSLSWTATDANPNNYTIELQGSGIVAGPTPWTSGIAINYDIPEGFSLGSYIYTINFTDDFGYLITDSVNLTVAEDITNPDITVSPSNFTVEEGYTGQSLSWTATDAHPDIYTIEREGTGIVRGPTPWASGIANNYDIPDGFGVGSYIYIVTFTDDFGYLDTDSVNFTVVEDTTNPDITVSPNNFIVGEEYTGQSLSWTATDLNPYNYTIERLGAGLVAGPTAWTSGNDINYDIPDGFSIGSYIYTVNFTDDNGNFITDSVTFTVSDITNPKISEYENGHITNAGYTGISFSWTAIDTNPNTYTIDLNGTGIVVSPTPWSNNTPVVYNIPDGFDEGWYVYTITFTDDYGNFVTDSATFTVIDNDNPTIQEIWGDQELFLGYTGESLTWTVVDANPNTYTIELQGSGIVAGPTAWTSNVTVIYNIPDGFGVGDYVYTATFTDDYGYSISDTVTVTVVDPNPPGGAAPAGGIPFGNSFLIFIGLSVICLIFIKKRQIVRESR